MSGTGTDAPHGRAGEEFVLFGIPDMHGSIRGKALRPAAFESAVERGTVMTDLLLGLDPVDTPITDYEGFGIRTGAADLLVRPEPMTLREIPWRPGWRVCLATPSWPDGSPCELATREVYSRVLDDMDRLGYGVMAAIEYEVRIWDADGEPLSSGISYSLQEIARYERFLDELVRGLDGLGIELAAVHTEAGPGLLELNLAANRGVNAADDACLVKFATKQIAASMGLRASFLAKTAPGEEGSSGHVHMSCWSGDTTASSASPNASEPIPAFAASSASEPIPKVFGSAIAGVLDHLPAASLLMNPTVNSYKRLVPGWFAPTNVGWGYENRSCAVRAIRSSRPELWRLECRRPGADANPYLALAAIAASAADGIANGATPPAPIEGDAYVRTDLPELPGSLEAALRAFDEDATLRDALGSAFSEYFATSRAWELKAWRETVTDWERERYERTV
jgi:glutamine synthetase